MNCCEQSAPTSGCNQGRDCPVRSSRIGLDECAEAARLMDAGRIQHTCRVARHPVADVPILNETGKVWFVDSELSPPEELYSNTHQSCSEVGVCMGRADCACPDGLALYSKLPTSAIPAEAGNMQLPLSPYPQGDHTDDWSPLTPRDTLKVYGFVALFLGAWVGIIATASGYGWAQWGKGLMSYLAGAVLS